MSELRETFVNDSPSSKGPFSTPSERRNFFLWFDYRNKGPLDKMLFYQVVDLEETLERMRALLTNKKTQSFNHKQHLLTCLQMKQRECWHARFDAGFFEDREAW